MIHGGNTKAFQVFVMRSAILASAAIGVFWAFYALDFIIRTVFDGKAVAGPNPLLGYFAFDPTSVNNPISSLTGINAAAFGIVITVCSIIIQLTATINDMKTKFERGLKSGDEKFSATADIVFKTSDSQQFLTQPSSEPLNN